MKLWLIFFVTSLSILECLSGAITQFSDDSGEHVSIILFALFYYDFRYHVIQTEMYCSNVI